MNGLTLVIHGASGHGRVVADAALAAGKWIRVLATDRDSEKYAQELLPGVPVIDFETALAMTDAVFHIAIGNGPSREKESAAIGVQRLATVLHPDATVSPFAQLAPGAFVAAQAVVAPRARVGISTIVNHGAIVDHDCVVGDFTHVAPQVALGGAVRIGSRVLLGSGVRVLPGLSVGDNVTLGAGAVVNATIAAPGVYVGVPARRVK